MSREATAPPAVTAALASTLSTLVQRLSKTTFVTAAPAQVGDLVAEMAAVAEPTERLQLARALPSLKQVDTKRAAQVLKSRGADAGVPELASALSALSL